MHAQGDKFAGRRAAARSAVVPNTFPREPRGGKGGFLAGSLESARL